MVKGNLLTAELMHSLVFDHALAVQKTTLIVQLIWRNQQKERLYRFLLRPHSPQRCCQGSTPKILLYVKWGAETRPNLVPAMKGMFGGWGCRVKGFGSWCECTFWQMTFLHRQRDSNAALRHFSDSRHRCKCLEVVNCWTIFQVTLQIKTASWKSHTCTDARLKAFSHFKPNLEPCITTVQFQAGIKYILFI